MNLIIRLRFQIELRKKVRPIFLQKFASITCELFIYIQIMCESNLSIITIHKEISHSHFYCLQVENRNLYVI
jgi:hypothetical protein